MDKDNFNANVDFVRGQADMIVLSALSDSDKYGLEILSTIQERSQGMYSLKQATLYSSLKRLEKNGYVHSYDGDISNGAKRVYYGLTDMGRDHLNNDKSYWEFCNFLMTNLISDNKFDPQNESKPFDPAEFRPLTRRTRAEKDDKEQEKEVVVKYVYVKDGDIPQDADVVYLSPDQINLIDKETAVDDNQVKNEQEDSLQSNADVENVDDGEPVIEGEFQQQAFDLTALDFEDNSQGNQEDSQVEENENEAPLDFDLTEFDFSDICEEFVYDGQDPTGNFDLTEVVSAIESDCEQNQQELQHTQDTNDDVTQLDDNDETTDTDIDSDADIDTADAENEEDTPLSEDVNIHRQGTTESERIEVDSAVEENQSQQVLEDNAEAEPQEYQYSSFGDRPVRNPLPTAPASDYDTSALPYSPYSYENDVNYVGTFTDMFNVEDEEEPQPEVSADIDYLTLKEMVYKYQSKGITIKPYDKHNTMEYYVNRYYFSNKLHLHSSLIIFAILAVELFISHFICNASQYKVSDLWLLSILAIAIYPAIRAVMYVVDPTKKSYANYNPKTSLLLSLLPVITLPIVFALLGFVEFGANINDYASMQRPIILPSVLLFNVPLHSIIYTLLYRTYKYHVN